MPSNPKYYEFNHRPWRAKRHYTQDPALTLTVASENFRIDGRKTKLVMSQWKADIEKMGTVEIIVRDPGRRELVFRRLHFGHE
jgi:hypothetical protein